jgi:hypothetical protein
LVIRVKGEGCIIGVMEWWSIGEKKNSRFLGVKGSRGND